MAKVRVPSRSSNAKKKSPAVDSGTAAAGKKRRPNQKLLEFLKRTAAERAGMPAVDIGDSVLLIRGLRSGG